MRKVSTHQENKRDFHATNSGAEVIETKKCLYKLTRMFGPVTLIYWKDSGRISTRTGHNKKGLE